MQSPPIVVFSVTGTEETAAYDGVYFAYIKPGMRA